MKNELDNETPGAVDKLIERKKANETPGSVAVEHKETPETVADNYEENAYGGTFHERDTHAVNDIVKEISDSFLDYSMSVITSRAIPDLRDGLKPVHRRILWSMFEEGNTPDKPHKKSATTVGYVMGHYHPHGDSSIYDALVRLAQNFNQRYILVDGHGNFGNIEGDGAAAYRYTEARLSKISLEMLADIRKDTVDMMPNFDETSPEPVVLPSRFPNVLVNGSMGIAVGMATNIPPHNLGEVIDGCVAYIDNPDIDTMGLMQYIKGPDFPTGGIILGNSGIKKAYETGRGSITIRSKAEIVENANHSEIVITEVPYGVNTLELKNRVAELVRDRVIEGISDYHTDLKNGVKITITLKKEANAQVVLNNLYKHTNFQVNYGIIFLVIDMGTPKTLGLKDIIAKYVDFQKEVIYRRTKFDLDKDEKRAHILEGYKIAQDNIDEVVKIIKNALDDAEAKSKLMSRFGLTDIQSEAILELKLRRLTGLERDKIEEELKALYAEIEDLKDILSSEKRVLDIIKEEMLDIKSRYADDRRTKIDMTAVDYIEDESLIPNEDIMIAITKNGYIKRITSDTFKAQNRGGVGIKGMTTNDEDYVEELLNLSSHDYLLFFTNYGKTYRIKGYEVPEFSRTSKGLPIVNLLSIEKDEKINSVISVSSEDESEYLLFATRDGIVKKTHVSEFDNIRTSGKLCISLKENDELISVKKTNGNNIILLGADSGKMVKFDENDIRPMGRTASGVRGINLDGAKCICAEVVDNDSEILLVTEKGYGKRSNVADFRQTSRGSKGVKALNITDKNGIIVGVKLVEPNSDVIIMTDSGMTMRMSLEQINLLGRATQGTRLIHLKDNQTVAAISLVTKDENSDVEE